METTDTQVQDKPADNVDVAKLQKELADNTALLTEANALLKEIKNKPPEAPNIRKGENTMSSRPFSYGRLIRARLKKAQNDSDWDSNAKIELELGAKLRKETDAMCGGNAQLSEFCAPLASAFLVQDWSSVNDGKDVTNAGGEKLPGYSVSLVKEVKDHFQDDFDVDPAVFEKYGRQALLKETMQRNSFIYGGALVPSATRGELIEVLRNSMSLTSLPGIRHVPLPPQGTTIWPRQTSIASIDFYNEGQATSATDIQFGQIAMNAKKASGLVNVTEDLLRAASGTYSVESMLRMDIAEELGRKPDRDMIDGTGGLNIKGIVNIASILSYTCSTTGSNGDTLWPEDPLLAISQMAGRNAPVSKGVVLLMRPELWAKITTARDSNGQFLFQFRYANGGEPNSLFGTPVYLSTNLPNTRRKGSGVDLDLVLAVIPSEIMIGQSGVIDFQMTDSHASNFAAGIKTIRAVTYMDMALRHEASCALIDQIDTVRTGS